MSVIDHAKKDLNLRENPRGSNRHPRIQEMLRNCGLNGAYAWCSAAGVTWLKEYYGSRNPVKMSADCDVILAQAKKTGKLYSTPQPLDIGLRVSKHDPDDATHFLLVDKLLDEQKFLSIEGNTNNDGSREGYGVFQLTRNNRDFKYFRWIELLKNEEGVNEDIELVLPQTRIVLPSGDIFAKAKNDNGTIIVPAREFYASLTRTTLDASADVIGFSNELKKATIKDHVLETSRLIGKKSLKSWCGAKELAWRLDYNVEFDNEEKVLYIHD